MEDLLTRLDKDYDIPTKLDFFDILDANDEHEDEEDWHVRNPRRRSCLVFAEPTPNPLPP